MIAPVSASGEVCVYVYGTAHVLVDISGDFPGGRVGPSTVTCGRASPTQLGFDPFYVTFCDAAGLAVLGSVTVDPRAVEEAARIAPGMIGRRPDIIDAMLGGRVRVGVIGKTEVTSDMPEYRNIYTQFPGIDWDTRARGLGATDFIPLSSVGEENLLCLPGDGYGGESIMVHEFAHTIQGMGLDVVAPAFRGRVERAYAAALDSGLWLNTYAGSNAAEYFAEAVQSYFDTNIGGPAGGDGIHNDVDTRAELAVYDPEIYRLVDEVFGGAVPDLGLCQQGRPSHRRRVWLLLHPLLHPRFEPANCGRLSSTAGRRGAHRVIRSCATTHYRLRPWGTSTALPTSSASTVLTGPTNRR